MHEIDRLANFCMLLWNRADWWLYSIESPQLTSQDRSVKWYQTDAKVKTQLSGDWLNIHYPSGHSKAKLNKFKYSNDYDTYKVAITLLYILAGSSSSQSLPGYISDAQRVVQLHRYNCIFSYLPFKPWKWFEKWACSGSRRYDVNKMNENTGVHALRDSKKH